MALRDLPSGAEDELDADRRPLESPHAGRGRRLSAALRRGEPPSDREFDELYPVPIRMLSATFWTPVDVAIRAAYLLASRPGERVLDVGAGVGKFCLLGALTTPAHFVGVEQRGALVSCARAAAALLGVENVTFEHGLFTDLDAQAFDAFYFFNPFGENRFAPTTQIDDTVELTIPRFVDEVWCAQAFLARAKIGARVVTYNGMGGELPCCYARQQRDDSGLGLDVWVKTL